MLGLVARRALAQRRLLAGVLALVTVGATLLGVCTLLLTVTQERALTRDVQRRPASDVAVTAYLVTVAGADAASVRDGARAVVGAALAPLPSGTATTTVTAMRRLPGGRGVGYLESVDDVAARARLTAGTWPAQQPGAVLQAAVPERTAQQARAARRQPARARRRDPRRHGRAGGRAAGAGQGRRHVPAGLARRVEPRPVARQRVRPRLHRRHGAGAGVRALPRRRRRAAGHRLDRRLDAGGRHPRPARRHEQARSPAWPRTRRWRTPG
nr:hypothetical protein [Angustibacter aerolatus]